MERFELELSELNLPSNLSDSLSVYLDLLDETARRAGLIGFRPEQLLTEVFRSLTLMTLVSEAESLLDVGSGAGLPGIPLAIAGVSVTLLDPKRKAAGFLEKVVREMNLRATVLRTRAEEAARTELRESFDTVVARAVGPYWQTVGRCAPLCKVGGKVLVTAGSTDAHRPDDDLRAALGLGEVETITLEGPLAIRQRVHMMSRISAISPDLPTR